MEPSIRVGVIGASGYSGEVLLRLLHRHPEVDLVWATSRSRAGQAVSSVFPSLRGCALRFERPDPEKMPEGVRAVFLALPHGTAAEFAVPLVRAGKRVFDLSADFRLRRPSSFRRVYGVEPAPRDVYRSAVYGLPERYRDAIRNARLVAVPGCYPTGVLLGILPAIEAGAASPEGAVISSMSGVSGAGRKAVESLLFCECNESVRAYGLLTHRHVPEMEQELAAASGTPAKILFTPHLVPTTRGILTTAAYPLAATGIRRDRLEALYRDRYGNEPFVRLCGEGELPDTKHVVGTNRCDVAVRIDRRTGRLLAVSAIDNLVKGAAGQAVQCMNIAFGLDETAGLES